MPNGLSLTGGRIAAGVWEGVLSGTSDTIAELEVTHLGSPIAGVQQIAGPDGEITVRVPIPVEVLNEGVQTFLIRAGNRTLAQFTVIAGDVLEDDLRSEIDLMRAELEILKRAFRRHFAD
ncbi:hypothetical protein [Tabrizicola sp. BL-A-41-H6]|uniref:hypothetical protein n=1 Tax=Tabrizicola sp. BL-A-41-H6 TaxID=3421107 RepID=UPI003D67EAED